MRRLLMFAASVVIGAGVVAADMPSLTIMDAIERGQTAMRTQVEHCQDPSLPPFVALPEGRPGAGLLIDSWGVYEVRAEWRDGDWQIYGVNPACDFKTR